MLLRAWSAMTLGLICLVALADQPVDLFDATASIGRSAELSGTVSAKRIAVDSPPWLDFSDSAEAYDLISDQAYEKQWTVQTVHESNGRIAPDDVLLLSLWIKVVDAPGGVAKLTCAVSNGEKSESLLYKRIQVENDSWQQLHLSGVANTGSDNPRLAIHAGIQDQRVLLGPVRLRNYGPDANLADLPQNDITYQGRAADAAWRTGAAERIRTHRTGPLNIIVQDADGKPIDGAVVNVGLRRHAFGFGSAVSSMLIGLDEEAYPVGTWARGPWSYQDAVQYRGIIDQYFRRVTPEASLRPNLWPQLQDPDAPGTFRWIPTMRKAFDGSIEFFQQRDIEVRGHYLSWGAVKHPPQDVFADSAPQHREYQMNILRTVPKEVGNRVVEWDAINHPCGWGTTMEMLHGGLDLHVDIIKEARRQVPEGVLLYVNEGNVISERSQLPFYKRIIQHLIDHDAAPDGIGMMAHFSETSLTGMDQAYEIFDDLGTMAPRLQITELDVSVGGDEQLQADYLRDFMTIAFSHPQMTGIVMWGFWEDCHWKPETALWRKDWSIKPSGEAFVELLTKTWHTRAEAVASTEGNLTVDHAFYGDYTVTVTKDGKTTEQTIRHAKGASEPVVLKLN